MFRSVFHFLIGTFSLNEAFDFHSYTCLALPNRYSGIGAKTTKTEESFFVAEYGLIVLIFDIYDYL